MICYITATVCVSQCSEGVLSFFNDRTFSIRRMLVDAPGMMLGNPKIDGKRHRSMTGVASSSNIEKIEDWSIVVQAGEELTFDVVNTTLTTYNVSAILEVEEEEED